MGQAVGPGPGLGAALAQLAFPTREGLCSPEEPGNTGVRGSGG